MRTFLQIQTDVFRQLKEDVGDTGFWTTDEVKDAINDAYVFVADDALCFRFERIIEIVAGERRYKLPSYYVYGSLNRVEFDEEIIFPISSKELDAASRSWRTVSSSEITHYMTDICASDEIDVYPMPDTGGNVYHTATDDGVVTTIGDDSYEEFGSDEGMIVDVTGDVQIDQTDGTGPVMEIQDPVNNLKVFAARYPKRLYRDEETFLHPISDNPRNILTVGAMAKLLVKEGEGKDIQKASYYNKRFMERVDLFKRKPDKRMHVVKSISDAHYKRGYLNLGDSYPEYRVR